ncbi:MAG: right-handed parallel beta-helix repeat-containing protein [Alcanivoracaceae bacterium]|nr:right-handed parallel beta-helix repeat-containing protein [Alcanivoracaceae bacterium]
MKTERSAHLFRLQALAAAIGLASGAAHAVDPVVTNLNDSGEGSLREALSLAENDEGVPSTVTFQEGLSGTISLSYSLGTINDSIVIQGSGITIKGPPAVDRVAMERGPRRGGNAVIRFSAEGTEDFTLSGLTITRGVGGGISAYLYSGSTLLLEDVVVTKNSGAPAVDVRGGSLELQGSVISGNSNEVEPGSYYYGNRDGGGIRSRNSDVLVVDSEIADNIANEDGGGIHSYYGSVTIERSVISGNVAGDDGGGIHQSSYNESTDLSITDSTVSGNVAGDNGGGIFFRSYQGGELQVDNSSVTGNQSDDDGAGIDFYVGRYSEGTFRLENSVVKNNSTADSDAGLRIRSESVEIIRSLIEGNTASESNGAFDINADRLEISRSTITGNKAPSRAIGDIDPHSESSYSQFSIDSTTISGHSSEQGSALSVGQGYGSTLIENSTISGNTARDPVIEFQSYSYSGGDLDIENSTFSGNRSTTAPSAIEVSGLNTSITHSTFVDNKAVASELFPASAQLSLVHTNESSREGGLTNSIFTSGNDVEVIVGGGSFNNRYSYGSVDVELNTVIMTNGVQVNEGGDTVGTPNEVDPLLAPLGYRGGFTLVHEPLPGSPALDAGGEGSRPDDRDQRGLEGNFGSGGNSDLGSVEVVSNTSPRLTVNLSKQIKGVLGTEIPVFNVTDLFVDDEGDNISVVNVTGLPAGLYSEGSNIGGTLEAAGTFAVTVVVTDDNATPLETVEQFEVTIPEKKSSSDSEVLGSVPAGFLALLSFMAILRRRNS